MRWGPILSPDPGPDLAPEGPCLRQNHPGHQGVCANVDPWVLSQRRSVRTLGWCLHTLTLTPPHTHTHSHPHPHSHPHSHTHSHPIQLSRQHLLLSGPWGQVSLPLPFLPLCLEVCALGQQLHVQNSSNTQTRTTVSAAPRAVCVFRGSVLLGTPFLPRRVPRGLGRPCHLPCLLATRIWDSCMQAHAVRVQCLEVAPEG